MNKILIFLLLITSVFCTAQNTTTVTATPIYPDGNNFANGTVLATFTPPTGTIDQNLYFINGATFPYYVSGIMNSGGQFTLVLTDDHKVRPLGGRWMFTVCSNASVPCTNSLQDVFGASIDLSTQIDVDVKTIFSPAFSLPVYFADTEVNSNTVGGQTYFNYISKLFRCWNGSAWSNCSSGVGGGSTVITATSPIVVTPSPITGTGVISCPTCSTSTATGTVTSIAETVPVGFSVAGSPITTSGTFAITTNGLTTNRLLKAITNGIGNSSINDDGTNPPQSPNGLDISTISGISMTVLNDTVTGTTLNLSICKSATLGQYRVCPSNTKVGVIGTAMIGLGTAPGTSGSVSACFIGRCQWIADGTTVIGDYGIPSTTTAGRIHDTGSTSPTAGVDNFLLLTATTVGNPVEAEFNTPDWFAANAITRVYNLQVNAVTLTAGDTVNFNDTTPTAIANALNIKFQTSKVGIIDSVSAQVVGDGNATHCLLGTGVFSACPGNGGGGANKISFDSCSPAQSINQGNSYWRQDLITYGSGGLANFDPGFWGFKNGSAGDVFCMWRVTSNITGTQTVIIDVSADTTTAGQVDTFNICDATSASRNVNGVSFTCGATQNYTTTATSGSNTELTFTLASTPSIDQYLLVDIHHTNGTVTSEIRMWPPKIALGF